MRKKFLYTKLIVLSAIITVIIGIWFNDTTYFCVRHDGVQIEISKKQYIAKLASNQNKQTLIKKQSFNFMLAIISWLLVFSFGIILSLFRGPKTKRQVQKPPESPKETDTNIRENIHPDSTFMG